MNEAEYQHMVAVERELIEIRILLTELVQFYRDNREESKIADEIGCSIRTHDDQMEG